MRFMFVLSKLSLSCHVGCTSVFPAAFKEKGQNILFGETADAAMHQKTFFKGSQALCTVGSNEPTCGFSLIRSKPQRFCDSSHEAAVAQLLTRDHCRASARVECQIWPDRRQTPADYGAGYEVDERWWFLMFFISPFLLDLVLPGHPCSCPMLIHSST